MSETHANGSTTNKPGALQDMRGGSLRFALLLLVLTCVACLPTIETRQRELWRLPLSYQGWIYTRWDIATCAPLEIRGGYLVVEVPPSGVVCTSSHLQDGSAIDRFVYLLSDGTEFELAPESAHERVFGNGSHDLYVFIGTAEDFGRVSPHPPSRSGP